MSSDSGGSEVSNRSDEIEQIERHLIKAITYSDEILLKAALKKYKREKVEIDDAKVLHHAVRLAKTKEIRLLLKAGLNASACNAQGLSALDVCLIEMTNQRGSEIDNWLKISVFLAQRAICRSKFTITLLKVQKDPRIVKQLLKLLGQPPLLLTTCLHKLRRSNIPALLESRFLIRKADRGSDDEVEFNSEFIQEINRKDRKRKRKTSMKNWCQFAAALDKRRSYSISHDFVELSNPNSFPYSTRLRL